MIARLGLLILAGLLALTPCAGARTSVVLVATFSTTSGGETTTPAWNAVVAHWSASSWMGGSVTSFLLDDAVRMLEEWDR
jgi:hypothetical protein